MKRIVIIVEGQTEADFFRKIVFPFFAEHGICDVYAYPVTTSVGHKGGNKFPHIKNEIQRVLRRYDHRVVISTFFDYYGLTDFPQLQECKQKPTPQTRADAIEKAFAGQLCDSRIVPYIQLHEFEALLFSSLAGFELLFPDIVPQVKRIIENCPNPELINDHRQTAPSKRILSLCKKYNKVVDGVDIAEAIGLTAIMQQCPRFSAWINRLIIEARIPC